MDDRPTETSPVTLVRAIAGRRSAGAGRPRFATCGQSRLHDVRRTGDHARVPDDSPVRQGLAQWEWTWFASRRALTGVVLVISAAAPVPPAAATGSAVLLTKREARRVTVKASADTCRIVEWCRGYRVVPAERCRRKSRRTVYCPMAFLTADAHRCGGGVLVMKTPRGRIGLAMAVPLNCSTGARGVPVRERPPELSGVTSAHPATKFGTKLRAGPPRRAAARPRTTLMARLAAEIDDPGPSEAATR
jgi:hypothetical protein